MPAATPSLPGSPDFVNELLGRLQGSTRNSSQSSVSSATNVSVNPVIVNNVGGGSPTVTPSIYAPASGSPYATGSASSSGSDVPSYLPSQFSTRLPTRVTAAGSSPFTSLSGEPVQDGIDPMLLVGGGLAALLLLGDF